MAEQSQIIATPLSSPTSQSWGRMPPQTASIPSETMQQDIDSNYVEIDLPSRYKFYDFQHLYIRPFKQKHLRKLIQGQANKNARYIAEVINSCITCEKGYKDLVFRLCREDFTYLQYWERLHSFPNIQYTQMIECTNPEHIAKVENGELPMSSLTFPQAITKANLEVTYLEEDASFDFEKYIPEELKNQYAQISMHVPYMEDYLQLLELAEKEVGDNDDEGLAWFMTGVPASMLTLVDANGKTLSLKERFDVVDNLSPEAVMLLQEVKDEVPEFGVIQTIKGKCPRCGAVTTTQLVLNAHSFLPQHHFTRGA